MCAKHHEQARDRAPTEEAPSPAKPLGNQRSPSHLETARSDPLGLRVGGEEEREMPRALEPKWQQMYSCGHFALRSFRSAASSRPPSITIFDTPTYVSYSYRRINILGVSQFGRPAPPTRHGATLADCVHITGVHLCGGGLSLGAQFFLGTSLGFLCFGHFLGASVHPPHMFLSVLGFIFMPIGRT